MNSEIAHELQSIKLLLSKLVGTSNLPEAERFSIDALNKAAQQFQKLCIERGDWIEERDFDKVIKNAPFQAGAFIRAEFGFTNCFRRGKKYYYNRTDLIALAKELKERNIDLKSYLELRADEDKFRKYLGSILLNSKGNARKRFTVPYDIKDIVSSPTKAPSAEIIKEDLKRLKEEFFRDNLSDYIDIHKGTHAMVKYEYYFQKYIKPDIKKQCNKWCENFNYANYALELVTKKFDKFIPVKDDDMIQL
jgi:hypothetical protein